MVRGTGSGRCSRPPAELVTLRIRLVLTIALVLATTMGATFSIIYVVVHRTAERQLNDALFAQAKEEALELVLAGGDERKLSEREIVELEDGTQLTRYAIIYRPDGAIQTSTTNFPCPLPALDAVSHPRGESFDFHCGPLHLRGAFVRLSDSSADRLLLAVSRTDLDAEARGLVRTMALALLASLLLGSVIALALTRSLTRGHEEIAKVARRVAAGDLTARVEQRPSDREVRQLGADIDRMIERMEQLVGSQEQFIAHAAHELRSPLTAAYGEIDLSLRRERTADEYREAMQFSHESLKRLVTLVTELLQLARAGSDAHVDVNPLSLDQIATNVANELSKAYAEKGVTLERDLSPCAGSGRAREIERLIRNLLENALRHTPSGKRVIVKTHEELGRAHLTVTDEGTGVTPQEAPHLFEPFFRGSGERATDATGSGLGLPIVRQIAEAHQGSVRFDTEYGPPGARFIVELQLRPETKS